jgi:hypothetical protein
MWKQETYVTGHADLVARYQHARQINRGLQNALVDALPKDMLEEAGQALGLLRDGVLTLSDEHELAVLFDHAIYGIRRDGRNAVERWLAEAPPATDPARTAVVQAMAAARFSIFLVESVTAGVGVGGRDLLRGDSLFVVDLGLSRTSSAGVMLAGRIISPPGFSMTTGAMLPVGGRSGEDLLERLAERFGDRTVGQFVTLSAAEESELATIAMRSCLASGASSYVTEHDASGGSNQIALTGAARRGPRLTPRTHRSGKKHKGRRPRR